MITRLSSLIVGFGVCLGSVGCSTAPKAEEMSALPVRPMLIAVAPAINLSGSTDFDPIKLGDLMASELGQIEGVDVIGVNRVLAVMNGLNESVGEGIPIMTQLTHPSQAVSVADTLGADAVLVFGVTEYDPYDPPTVGLAAQLYGCSESASRATSEEGTPRLAEEDVQDDTLVPRAQVQRTFRASRKDVLEEVKKYGKNRDAQESAYEWRRYVVSQEDYFRFCCHAVVNELVRADADADFISANSPKDEERMP